MIKILVLTGAPNSGCAQLIPKGTKLTISLKGSEDFAKYVLNNSNLSFELHKKILTPVGKQELIHPISFDLIVNVICDPDSNDKVLKKAIQIIEIGKGVPVINHPLKIFNTARDKVYQLLKEIKGLIVPKVWRLAPKKLKDIIEFVEKENIKFPFLFRPAGSHTGLGLVKIDSERQFSKLERFAFNGSDYYIIEFYDFKSEDGLYRKYRVFFVDKKPYPRHLIISKGWNIHASNFGEFMTYEPYKTERAEFLNNFDIKKFRPLLEIVNKIDLDYFAVDFGIDKKGNLVIFEANSCVKLLSSSKSSNFELLEPHEKRIIDAIKNMFIKRARNTR